MNITSGKNKKTYLYEISDGGCFYDPDSDTYNIKTSTEAINEDILIVNLESGDSFHEGPKTKVVPVYAEIIVRHKEA